MFFRLILSLQKCALVAVAFAGAEILAQSATNQVQEETIRDIETLEKNSSKIFRPYLPSNPFSDASEFAPPPSSLPTAPPRGAPFSSKRNEERIDRQKNWIFASPDKPEESASVEELFGAGGMMNERKSKGVVNDFLTRGRENVLKNQDDKEWDVFNLPTDYGLGNEQVKSANPLSRGEILDRYREQNRSGFSVEQNKLSQRWREQTSSARAREDRQTSMQDFENLFHPSESAAMKGNGLFGLDQNNLGSPAASASRGVPDRFNPGAPNSSSDPFRSGPRGVASAGITERPDVNTRVFGSSVNPLPKEEVRKPERQPAVLNIPKRKD